MEMLILLSVLLMGSSVFLVSPSGDTPNTELIDNREILISNFSARAFGSNINYSSTYVNIRNQSITFDAIIRLDSPSQVLALKAHSLNLDSEGSITITGSFAAEPGSYVVQWEALTPPPGTPIAEIRRAPVDVTGSLTNLNLLIAFLLALAVGSVIILGYQNNRHRRISRNNSDPGPVQVLVTFRHSLRIFCYQSNYSDRDVHL